MRKFLFMMMALLMSFSVANAQIIATENAKVLDNTYVGIEIGEMTPLNFNSVFPLNTVAGLKFGKEFTPQVGIEVEGTAVFGDNLFRNGVNTQLYDGSFNVHKNGSVNTFVKATNIGLNGVINWSNVLFGYQGTPRKFEVKTNTGFGWLHYFGNYTPTTNDWFVNPNGKHNVLTAKTAVDFAFNVGKTKAHTLNLSPGVYWNLNEAGNVKFNKNYAQFGIMVGYTYHFKTSNGTHAFKTYDVSSMINDINNLKAELAKKPKEIIHEKVVIKEVTANKSVNDVYVFFAFDSFELDDRAKAELDKLGQNGVYCVDAFASSEGSTEYNNTLSQKRADVVKTYLENRGVKIESAVGHGVQFGNTTGRIAIVTTK